MQVLKADMGASSSQSASPEEDCMFMTGASVHPGANPQELPLQDARITYLAGIEMLCPEPQLR